MEKTDWDRAIEAIEEKKRFFGEEERIGSDKNEVFWGDLKEKNGVEAEITTLMRLGKTERPY